MGGDYTGICLTCKHLDLFTMITEHPTFQAPSNVDIPIWRYMDLSKFIALIQSQSLYFPIITNLGDPFEGSVPSKELMIQYVLDNRHPGGELERYG